MGVEATEAASGARSEDDSKEHHQHTDSVYSQSTGVSERHWKKHSTTAGYWIQHCRGMSQCLAALVAVVVVVVVVAAAAAAAVE